MDLVECPTGIPGFDEVTGGGFYRGQIILVTGNPGSGKTTFAAKFIHEGAKMGEAGVYVSLGESKNEFYSYMKKLGMNFEELERKRLFTFVEMLTPLDSSALMNLSEKLVTAVTKFKAKRVVIDPVSPVLQLTGKAEVRAIIHNAIKTLAKTHQVTMVLTIEKPYGEEKIGFGVEEFIADGVVHLKLIALEEGAPRRVMEISKLRGRPLGRVVYEYEIGSPYGIRVLLPSVVKVMESAVNLNRRITTGIKVLDKILGGGLIEGTITLLEGSSGTGKSLIALNLAAANVLEGKHVTYVSFDEPLQQIKTTINLMGYDFDELVKRGLKVLSLNPKAITLENLYALTNKMFRRTEGETFIMILDGLTALSREFSEKSYRLIRDLSFNAKNYGISVILTVVGEKIESLAHTFVDTIMKLRIKEKDSKLVRELIIAKARMIPIEPRVYEVVLLNNKPTIKTV